MTHLFVPETKINFPEVNLNMSRFQLQKWKILWIWIVSQSKSGIKCLCLVRYFQCDQNLWNFSSLAKIGSLWQFLTVYFLFGKMPSIFWQIWAIIGLIFIATNSQKLNNNLTLWSHCSQLKRRNKCTSMVRYFQCDQTWWNFSILAKNCKFLAFFEDLIRIGQNWKIMLWGIFIVVNGQILNT